MMDIFQIMVLAFVQGVTEFLPVSSSGHLAVIQNLFKLSTASVFFDILLHLGTVLSILIFFAKDIVELIKKWRNNLNLLKALIIGSFPAAIFGYFLNSKIEAIFDSMPLVGISMIVCGFILLSTKIINKQNRITELKNIGNFKSFIIGLFQAIAVLPGISRSGSTITGGLWQGLSKEIAFKFSFLLSIPAVLGAVLLKAKDANFNEINGIVSAEAVLISALVGYFSLKILQKVLKSDKFWLFSIYCFPAGIFVLIFIK